MSARTILNPTNNTTLNGINSVLLPTLATYLSSSATVPANSYLAVSINTNFGYTDYPQAWSVLPYTGGDTTSTITFTMNNFNGSTISGVYGNASSSSQTVDGVYVVAYGGTPS